MKLGFRKVFAIVCVIFAIGNALIYPLPAISAGASIWIIILDILAPAGLLVVAYWFWNKKAEPEAPISKEAEKTAPPVHEDKIRPATLGVEVKCNKCKNMNEGGSDFCNKCGAEL